MSRTDEPFWNTIPMARMNREQWESLCDGCGLCCLHKLEDENTGRFYYTNVACRLLDLDTARCRDYPHRHRRVPDCIELTPQTIADYGWLPTTCSYRLLSEGKDLPPWHHLVCGDHDAVHRAGISRIGRMVSEDEVREEDWEDHIIFRLR